MQFLADCAQRVFLAFLNFVLAGAILLAIVMAGTALWHAVVRAIHFY
jgi:hypothetical protein